MRLPLRAWKNTLTSLGFRPKTESSRPAARRRSFNIEQLEARQLLSVSKSFSAGVLTVSGDSANDPIAITASGGNVKVNGDDVSGVTAAASVTAIVVDGGAGNDTINLSGVTSAAFTAIPTITVLAGDGDDILIGSPLNDYLYGNAGSDEIDPGAGNDYVEAGEGDDTLIASLGNDYVWDAGGSDTYLFDSAVGTLGGEYIGEVATADTDTLDFSAFTSAVTLNLSNGGGNNQTVGGGLTISLMEDVSATGFENFIGGSSGNDITGNSRDNVLIGGASADYLYGLTGNDEIDPGAGNDYVEAGTGDDTLIASLGNDYVWDSGGNDTYRFDSAVGTLGGEYIGEVATADTDTLDFSAFTSAVALNLSNGGGNNQTVGGGLTISLMEDVSATGFENFIGGSVGSTVTGNSRDNVFIGDANADTFSGGDGVDTLTGAGGVDTLMGNAGNDLIYGGDGNDSLWGGAGDDELYGEVGNDTLNDYDHVGVTTQGGNDTFDGGEGNDTLTTHGDDDILIGGPGTDGLYGGDGSDEYRFEWVPGEEPLGTDTVTENPADGDNDFLNLEDFYAPDYDAPDEDTADTYVVSDSLTIIISNSSSVEDRVDPPDVSSGYVGVRDEHLRVVGLSTVVISSDVNGKVTVNGVATEYAAEAIVHLTVSGTSGEDLFDLSGISVVNFVNLRSVHLFGSAGDDQILGSNHTENFEEQDPYGDFNFDTYVNRFDIIAMLRALIDVAAYKTKYGIPTDEELLERVDINGDGQFTNRDIQAFLTVLARLPQGFANGQPPETTQFVRVGNDVIFGGDGNDILQGGIGNDSIYGGEGDDRIYGGFGKDVLSGMFGSDAIYGGGGRDFISGGYGADFMFGQDGDDHITDINYGSPGAAGGDDHLDGGDGDDFLQGVNGDDTLIGGVGDDWLEGGTGLTKYSFPWTVGNYSLGIDNIEGDSIEGAVGPGILDFSEFLVDDFDAPPTGNRYTPWTVSETEAPKLPAVDTLPGRPPVLQLQAYVSIETVVGPIGRPFVTDVIVDRYSAADGSLRLTAIGPSPLYFEDLNSVNFYWDVNRNGILDEEDEADGVLGTDTEEEYGWSIDLPFDEMEGGWVVGGIIIPSNLPSTFFAKSPGGIVGSGQLIPTNLSHTRDLGFDRVDDSADIYFDVTFLEVADVGPTIPGPDRRSYDDGSVNTTHRTDVAHDHAHEIENENEELGNSSSAKAEMSARANVSDDHLGGVGFSGVIKAKTEASSDGGFGTVATSTVAIGIATESTEVHRWEIGAGLDPEELETVEIQGSLIINGLNSVNGEEDPTFQYQTFVFEIVANNSSTPASLFVALSKENSQNGPVQVSAYHVTGNGVEEEDWPLLDSENYVIKVDFHWTLTRIVGDPLSIDIRYLNGFEIITQPSGDIGPFEANAFAAYSVQLSVIGYTSLVQEE